MTLTISIRDERSDDAPMIATLVRRAYSAIYYSDHREHLMIERLRQGNAYLPQLSLLAEEDDQTVATFY